MDNWFELIAFAYLLGMLLYGHYKGLLRLMISIISLLSTILIINVFAPKFSNMLIQNSRVQDMVKSQIYEAISLDNLLGKGESASQQRLVIEELNLPDVVKDVLLENNNREIYDILGVERFIDYIAGVIVRMIVNTIGFAVMFVLIYAVIRSLFKWINLFSRIPIISGVNKIAGAVAGLFQGIFFLWLVLMVISLCSETAGGQIFVSQIEKSVWISYLYHTNILSELILISVKKMI